MTCVAPFTIPDRWIERQTPTWDPNDTFNAFPSQSVTAARRLPRGRSCRLHRLRLGRETEGCVSPSRPAPATTSRRASTSASRCLAAAAPSDYEWNIANCNTSVMHFGELLIAEPGNMVGPTRHGHRRPHRAGPDGVLGHGDQQGRQLDGHEPAGQDRADLRSLLLERRQDERPHRGPEGRQLHRFLHRRHAGERRDRPHHAGERA